MKMIGGVILTGAALFLLSFKKNKGSSVVQPGMVGKYFSYDEVMDSPTCEAHHLHNTPDEYHLYRAMLLAENILDPIREWLDNPIVVNSWYRSPECNAENKGKPNSKHMTGGAADIETYIDGQSRNDLIVRAVLHLDLPFDKIILEKGNWKNPNWIHIEYDPEQTRKKIVVLKNDGDTYELDRQTAEETFL